MGIFKKKIRIAYYMGKIKSIHCHKYMYRSILNPQIVIIIYIQVSPRQRFIVYLREFSYRSFHREFSYLVNSRQYARTGASLQICFLLINSRQYARIGASLQICFLLIISRQNQYFPKYFFVNSRQYARIGASQFGS